MIRPTPLVAFLCLSLALANACTPPATELSHSDRSTGTEDSQKNLFLIPAIRENQSPTPLIFWVSDLTRPKLLSNRALSVKCDATSPNALLISFPETYPKCLEVLALNRGTTLASSLACLDAQHLKVSGLKTPCDTRDLRQLGTLRDLPQSSLYVRDEKDPSLLIPNSNLQSSLRNALPTFQEAQASDLLAEAPLHLWLSQSAKQGVLALDLNLAKTTSKNSSSPTELVEGIQLLRQQLMNNPKTQRLAEITVEIISTISIVKKEPPTQLKKNAASPGFFFVVTELPSDPLLRGACGYIANWVHSTQLLQQESLTKGKIKKIPLSCSFRLADEIPDEPALRITELPLPLISSQLKRFPIKNLDELRSVAVLQSFRVLK